MKSAPKTGFKYLLGRLPQNDCLLFSDAASLFGMGGVIMLGEEERRKLGGNHGLFWRLIWHEWYEMVAMNCPKPGNVKINRAEFVAALITCETFANDCAGRYTTLDLDNYTAKAWIDSAGCPGFPFDRCAQGVHLYMLEQGMKIRTKWIPTAANSLADACSRKTFGTLHAVHIIGGARLQKVRPKWRRLVKFL